MQIRRKDVFTTIRTEGAILPSDLLQRIAEGGKDIPGLDETAYHLSGERINEAVNRAWNRLQSAWKSFQGARSELPETDLGTRITRERWLLPLFQELGYGRLLAQKSAEIGGKPYPISHGWQHTPIHLPGFRVDLDRRMPGVAGAARMSPHSMVQEYLNRSDDHLWAFVSNGLNLRVLRDNVNLTRQAYVEFDLESMLEGEVYADFVVLWLICHQSRVEAENWAECWLEQWSRLAHDQGTRALDQLREGVQAAIEAIGSGFLSHPANESLRAKLKSGMLDKQEYYRQILRFMYRLIFLFVAEDRDLLLDPRADYKARERYLRFYALRRIRELAEKKIGSRHADLFHGVRLVMKKLGSDQGCPDLALPTLGSLLFAKNSTPDLEGLELGNRSLMAAVRAVSFITFEGKRRPVDFKNLGSEELGSVYESLLELHPDLNSDTGAFELKTAGGHERKTTGSYYTPSSLVQCLLDSALEPVVEESLKKENPEQAILNLKVCDPACGSGHFLVAAAHRMAKRLAAVRTGDEEPSPEATRMALRDVIGCCIYGVDINPMAVELCKVSLWLEAMDPERPLSFLDHHIQCGNSLLGTTPALLEKGIPDEAFKPIEGDDKEYCRIWKQHNKQMPLFEGKAQIREGFEVLSSEFLKVAEMDDSTIWGVREKQLSWGKATQSTSYLNERMLADTWCAAFVWVKKPSAKFAGPITNVLFRKLEADPTSIDENVKAEIQRLSEQYRFFHWHLAFPDVFRLPNTGEKPENEEMGWNGGFDVALGNPPWERVKLQEKEWFAGVRPDIATAPNAAKRRKMIQALKDESPAVFKAFLDARRESEGISHLLRNSERYPLCGRGDINTYAIFAELKRSILSLVGRVGCIVPSGIATDDTTKYFFQDLMKKQSLASLYDFENRQKLFPEVDSRMKFCLLTLTGSAKRVKGGAEFVFFAHQVQDLKETERRFSLTAQEIELLNPNTLTCPIFRSKRDAELTKYIYRRVPVLIREARDGQPEQNPWGIKFLRMFDMSNDSGLFRTKEQLEAEGWALRGNVFEKEGDRYLPLYEAKMIWHFDHRWATYVGTETNNLTTQEKNNPSHVVRGRYWIHETEVQAVLFATGWQHQWLIGFRDITNVTNERTVVSVPIPRVPAGHTCPLILSDKEGTIVSLLYSSLSTYVLDFAARQKIGGTHLTYGYFNQIPVFSNTHYFRPCLWSGKNQSLQDWLLQSVLELTFTAWDLEPFARDCGYEGPPFRWDEERRFLIRCELDAAFFHLYLGSENDWKQKGSKELLDYFPAPRDAVEYIMETFPIVKRKDIQKHGDYRTKLTILKIYDEMKMAMETGKPYQTILDPPPRNIGDVFNY